LETIFIGSFKISWKKSSKIKNCLKKSKIEKLDIGKIYARKLEIRFKVSFGSQKPKKNSKFGKSEI
jgi:hypothetical protein